MARNGGIWHEMADKPKPKPKPRKPRGRPLERSDADLERLATVRAGDIEDAKAAVAAASPLLARILNAEEIDEGNESADETDRA